MDQLAQNLKAGAARAVIGTAINGGSFGDALAASLKTALIDTAAAQGAFAIGDWTEAGRLDAFTNKIAHAIAGCAAGAAKTGDANGCGAGAIGASMGELAAELYGRKADTVEFASMMGAIAAALSGASAADVALASNLAGNAAANNYVAHSQVAEIRKTVKKENARLTDLCIASGCTEDKLRAIDRQMGALEGMLTIQTKGVITEDSAKQMAQFIMEVLPVYGTTEALVQLATGRSSLTDEEASRFWAAIGVVPIAGGIIRKVGEPSIEALAVVLKSVATQKLQQQRIGELAELFSKQGGGSSVSLGGKPYQAIAEGNGAGNTKIFDTTGLALDDLKNQVFSLAGDIAGSRPLVQMNEGLWATKLDDGTIVNVRSISSSGVGRWTIELRNASSITLAAEKSPKVRFELKFK